MTVTEVLLSHIVVQYIVLSVQTGLMMLVLFVFFDNPMVGSLVWSLSLLFLTGTSGMCYGKCLNRTKANHTERSNYWQIQIFKKNVTLRFRCTRIKTGTWIDGKYKKTSFHYYYYLKHILDQSRYTVSPCVIFWS